MTAVILGHPYSGSLYAYFNDDLQEPGSSRERADGNSYYKLVYGKRFAELRELALTFLMLYDKVWLIPADNPLPESSLAPGVREHIPELGLHFDDDLFQRCMDSYFGKAYDVYLSDPAIRKILGAIMRIPKHSWSHVLRTAQYESLLSVKERCPLLCSFSERLLIERMLEIDKPSLHPQMPSEHNVEFIQNYREIRGMALAPRTSDQLMLAKPDKQVRSYAKNFLDVAMSAGDDDIMDKRRVAMLLREARETERVSKHSGGVLNWAGSFFRAIHEPVTASLIGAGGVAANYFGDQAGWYNFNGSIDRAISESESDAMIDSIIGEYENPQ